MIAIEDPFSGQLPTGGGFQEVKERPLALSVHFCPTLSVDAQEGARHFRYGNRASAAD